MSFYDDDAFDWDSVAQATDRIEAEHRSGINSHGRSSTTTFFVCPDCGFKPDDGSAYCSICAGNAQSSCVRRQRTARVVLPNVRPNPNPKPVQKSYTQSKLSLLIPAGHPSSEKPKNRPVSSRSAGSIIDLSYEGEVENVQRQVRNGFEGRSYRSEQKIDADPLCIQHAVDNATIRDYLYPKSDTYACREYQSKIVKSALLMNTLVVLPTGLGKTFIAAVVMCNFLRWFPEGKIIFMAPTRPLVTQQIGACHNIVGIDEQLTAQLMGSVKPEKRALLWKQKRLFYCTPQTAEKDAQNNILPAEKVVLIVVDEAHRATGNYAYTNVVRYIRMTSKTFRILALSATPGKNPEKVQEVINNLLIAKVVIDVHVSLRSGVGYVNVMGAQPVNSSR